jgi:hypothetical protein
LPQASYLLGNDVLLFESTSTEVEDEPLVAERLPQRRTTTTRFVVKQELWEHEEDAADSIREAQRDRQQQNYFLVARVGS